MLEQFIDNPREDSLTAAVFSHLLHLPSEVFWQILRNACYTKSLPQFAGEPRLVQYWPKWNADGSHNSRFVEPDVFIRFAHFDLIIEAKRDDECQQYRGQWENEVIAYDNEYGAENVAVKIIAVGGVWQLKDEAVTFKRIVCPVYMCKWTRLLEECKCMQKELQRIKYPSSHTLANMRTLTHLIDFFAWHGYSSGLWFADFNFDKNRLSPVITSCFEVFPTRTI